MAEYVDSHEMTEEKCVEFLNQIISGFKCIRERRIMHRDFKLANVLLHKGLVKIADFGFSKQFNVESRASTFLGTLSTMAPEVIKRGGYDSRADIWSIGAVFYSMLAKKSPYIVTKSYNQNRSEDDEIMLQQILANNPPKQIDQMPWSTVVKDFLKRILVADPDKRMVWSQLFSHPITKYSQSKFFSQEQINELFSTIL